MASCYKSFIPWFSELNGSTISRFTFDCLTFNSGTSWYNYHILEINLKDSSGEKTGECNSAEDDENLDDYVEMKRVDLS
jgi:hypothetical protein